MQIIKIKSFTTLKKKSLVSLHLLKKKIKSLKLI